MKLRSLLIASLLLSPSAAYAVPITAGVWSQVTDVNSSQGAFWEGLSWDCPTCGVGYMIEGQTGLEGIEYLHDGTGGYVQFQFDDPILTITPIFSITGWTGGVLAYGADGAFNYNSGTGRLSNSWESSQQYALFRRVGTDTTQYFMGVEDILLSEPSNDRDYNDYGVTFTTATHSVPEPSTLLLMGLSLVGLAALGLRTPQLRRAAAAVRVS